MLTACAEWREDELFTELPAALRAEVAGVLLLGTLRRIPTFAECEPLPALKKPQKPFEGCYKCTCAAARRHHFLHWAFVRSLTSKMFVQKRPQGSVA